MNVLDSNILDTYIIGAGPGGMASALQLSRYPLTMRIAERDHPGGLLRNANSVENILGFHEKISGLELIARFKTHLDAKNIEIHAEEVLSVDYIRGLFTISTRRDCWHAKTVIAATGTRPRALTDIAVSRNCKPLIMSDIVSIGTITGKKIAIIGAGDAAFDYSLQLSRSNQVVILNRTNRLRCLPLLYKTARRCSSITYLPGVTIQRIRSGSIKAVGIYGFDSQGEIAVDVDFVLAAIGREPDTRIVSPQLGKFLYSLIDRKLFFFVGDVKNNRFRQAAIATGDGIRAAMSVWETLESRRDGYSSSLEREVD